MRPFDDGWRCLILRAYRNWDLPKGMPEQDENLLQTALRETTEETGLMDLELPWGEEFRETEPYGKGKVVRVYLALSRIGEVVLPVNAQLGRPEHHEFRWVALSQARQLLLQRFWPMLDWAEGVAGEGEI
ncbi:NUDIX domain-containing protein [Cupriavidus sp. AU9028]|nr:NUDIX domain-containing protein [Cupriavidus sp. AU9028]